MPETDATTVRSTIELARGNEAFRRTIVTGEHTQLVAMTIQPREEIGEEVHEHGDQILFFEDGEGEAVIEGASSPVGGAPLRLLTVYGPPEHPAGTVHETKAEADAAEE